MPPLSNSYLKEFFGFLEFATQNELQERQQGLQSLLDATEEQEFRQTLRWLMRRVEEEILDRLLCSTRKGVSLRK